MFNVILSCKVKLSSHLSTLFPAETGPNKTPFLPFFFLGLHLQHMEVPRLGATSELQLPVYATATATATQDPSPIFDTHHRSQKHRILNLLSEARDQTRNLIVPSPIH